MESPIGLGDIASIGMSGIRPRAAELRHFSFIANVRSVAAQIQERELSGKDDQLARMVDFVVVPLRRLQVDKPAVDHTAMCDNALIIETRTVCRATFLGARRSKLTTLILIPHTITLGSKAL